MSFWRRLMTWWHRPPSPECVARFGGGYIAAGDPIDLERLPVMAPQGPPIAPTERIRRDERKQCVREVLFLRDCLPMGAEVARKQLTFAAEALGARLTEEALDEQTPNVETTTCTRHPL